VGNKYLPVDSPTLKLVKESTLAQDAGTYSCAIVDRQSEKYFAIVWQTQA